MTLMTATALAHFPWLATDDAGHALLFFSESPLERDYTLPESVTQAEVHLHASGKAPRPIELAEVDEAGEFVGRRSAETISKSTGLTTEFEYGVWHGKLLKYYASHQPGLAEKFSTGR